MCSKKKRCRHSYDLNCSALQFNSSGNGFCSNSWDRLQCLSLWIGVGELLTPLTAAGLEDCPNLEEIQIKVEGDCREWSKHAQYPFWVEHSGAVSSLNQGAFGLWRHHRLCTDCTVWADGFEPMGTILPDGNEC
ncbi:unnamed protein product [Coffea canephora]|uniref:Uncharacterized protein n=1 Tax=Coffea canephora TaxID=49390 RepID=A0A068V9P9_COFCA|nr:unnamed protein product [Coffea canephora]